MGTQVIKRRKSLTKTVALLMALLIALLSSVLSTAAITVEKDGKEYILNSRTPTVGDVNVLMIRLGFADYPVDDEEDPADSEETLLSYFDGSQSSINGFYETSSYGKLRLHCDTVYTYNAQYDREDYSAAFSTYSVDDLMQEALTALDEAIDYRDFDSDGDGHLDVVCFDYAGSMGNWGDTWWPHVAENGHAEVEGKTVSVYSLLRGDLNTFIHEFGHIFGAADYYSYISGQANMIMTYDMMSTTVGDHNGFTKWSYRWLEDEDIAFVDKATGDTVVSLAPIETPLGDGKKIAVVAPSFSSDTRFLDDFFLVEYDAGEGNNQAVFEDYEFEPGFRIFHVNAEAEYMEELSTANFQHGNDEFGVNLIHNMRNELGNPRFWEDDEMFFREGDALTPEGYPNTGLTADTLYNGRFTGISFTDFVTGDAPSFKVSFSDEEVIQPEPQLSLKTESLTSDIRMTLTSDQPLVQKKQSNEGYEAPYLISADGTKLLLDIKSHNSSLSQFDIRYTNASPAVQPQTDYTLVIPAGYFSYGYNQDVPEFRQNLTTESFMMLTEIERYSEETGKRYSNTFSVTDNTYGRIEMDGSTAKCDFIEFNLNGEEIDRHSFIAPVSYETQKYLIGCRAVRLYDGNYALGVGLIDRVSYFKFDKNGRIISGVFTLTDEQLDGYVTNTSDFKPVPFKDGLFAQLLSADYRSQITVKIDFENEPTIDDTDTRTVIPLDRDHYLIKSLRNDELHLDMYDRSDSQTADIYIANNFMGAYIKDDRLHVLTRSFEYDDDYHRISTLLHEVYDLSGEKLSGEDITDISEDLKDYYQIDRMIPTDSGCYIVTDDQFDEKIKVFVCDAEWNKLGEFGFSRYNEVEFLGECGLYTAYQYFAESHESACIISRFNIGDFEIAEKRHHLLGDANLDGVVDITDATTIQRYNVKMTELSDEALTFADVDRDGEVTIIDATLIQRWLVDLPADEDIEKPINDEPDQPSVSGHKLLSSVKAYQKDYETGVWKLSQTTTIEYDEHGYPVLFDLLENYEDAEHILTNITYTYDGDLPLTRTEINEALDQKTTVEYSNGRVYNVKEETVSSGSYRKLMYQYGHGDDYFTMVLHDVYRPGNEYNPDVYMEEIDSVSITTENGLFKSTTNTGMYAYWGENQEKKWIRFNGVYTADYDSDGIVSLLTANYSSFGVQPYAKYEVIKKNGQITEIIQYASDGQGGWERYAKYDFKYHDIEISAARYASMINYYITNHGGNYYIFNWY